MKGKKLLDIVFSALLDLEAELVRHFILVCMVFMLSSMHIHSVLAWLPTFDLRTPPGSNMSTGRP